MTVCQAWCRVPPRDNPQYLDLPLQELGSSILHNAGGDSLKTWGAGLPESWRVHPQGLLNHHVQVGQAFLEAAVLRGQLMEGWWQRRNAELDRVPQLPVFPTNFRASVLTSAYMETPQDETWSHPNGIRLALRRTVYIFYYAGFTVLRVTEDQQAWDCRASGCQMCVLKQRRRLSC